MSPLFVQAGWTAIFAWITYATGQTILMGRRKVPFEGRLLKLHRYVMQPFGAVLTFVFAALTVGASYSLIEMLLSQ